MDSRRGFRYAVQLANREAILHLRDRQTQAAVVDFSDDGIGLLVEDATGIEVGSLLQYEEPGDVRRPARVMFVAATEADLFRVGLEVI